MKTSPRWLALSGVLLAMLLASACDSKEDPVIDPAEVVGAYEFTTLTFDPDGSATASYDLLDTLSVSSLQLIEGGVFVLTYRFAGSTSSTSGTGNFQVTEDEVRLQANQGDAAKLAAILLDANFNLRRDVNSADVLSGAYRKSVDLSTLSNDYPQALLPGMLEVQLRRN